MIENVDNIAINDIVQQVREYWKYFDNVDWDNIDYCGILKAINLAKFLKAKFNNESKYAIMKKTLAYRDDEICIFKPTNFKESSIIGEPICCFAYSQDKWDEHYNDYQEAIYYVYDVMRDGTIEDFVAITVRPNGRALVLDKEHNWWTQNDSIRYINGLGNGAMVIATKEGKPIKSNINCNKNRNMNKKQIRLTESDLHRIVKESVKKVLRESLEGTDEIEEAVTNAASVIADAYHVQNGMQDIANDHDDSWYELQENLREAMFGAAMDVLNSAY